MRRSTFGGGGGGVKSLYLSSSDEAYVEEKKVVKERVLDTFLFRTPSCLAVPLKYNKDEVPFEFRASPESLLNLTLKIIDQWPLPNVYEWDIEKVCRWLRNYGYPQYQNIFRGNMVNGRSLLLLDASALPAMNIKDFNHIRHITYGIRCLYQYEMTKFGRSLTLPKENILELYKLLRVKNGRKYETSKRSELWRRMDLICPLTEYKDHWSSLENHFNPQHEESLRIGLSRRFNLYGCKKLQDPKQEKPIDFPCLCMPPCECNWTKKHLKPPSRLKCMSPTPQEVDENIKVLSVLPSRFHERNKHAAYKSSSILTWSSKRSGDVFFE